MVLLKITHVKKKHVLIQSTYGLSDCSPNRKSSPSPSPPHPKKAMLELCLMAVYRIALFFNVAIGSYLVTTTYVGLFFFLAVCAFVRPRARTNLTRIGLRSSRSHNNSGQAAQAV